MSGHDQEVTHGNSLTSEGYDMFNRYQLNAAHCYGD